jgi:predicted RNA-binding Zn-ribbon protein involved in translation (DUF1610 family)
MIDQVQVPCPHCGEVNEVDLSALAVSQAELPHQCESCNKEMRLLVTRDEWGDPEVQVEAV